MAWLEDLFQTLLVKIDSESAGRSMAIGAVAAIGESWSSNIAIFASDGILPGLDPLTVAGLVAFGAFPIVRRWAVNKASKSELEFKNAFNKNPDHYLDVLEGLVDAGEKTSVEKVKKLLSGKHVSADDAYRMLKLLLHRHYLVQ